MTSCRELFWPLQSIEFQSLRPARAGPIDHWFSLCQLCLHEIVAGPERRCISQQAEFRGVQSKDNSTLNSAPPSMRHIFNTSARYRQTNVRYRSQCISRWHTLCYPHHTRNPQSLKTRTRWPHGEYRPLFLLLFEC